jgi:SOS-response transcriptional repressor LexA
MKHQPLFTGRVLGYRAVQVLAYVREEIEKNGIAPSYDMICDALGMSTRKDVWQVINSLERRGLLSRAGSGRVRRLRLQQ